MRDVEAYSRLAGVYDEIVVDPCYGHWAAFLAGLWSTDPAPVRNVLDVCCGTGLLAHELIARGYRVVGVDASEAMLDVARKRLGREVVLRRTVLPELAVEGVFDAAVCTFDGLNYLTREELRLAIGEVALRLRRGGWFVFDLHTARMMEFTLGNPVVAGEADGNAFVISSVVDPDARTCDTRIELTRARDGDPFSEQHRQYFHTDDEVGVALQDAGFVVDRGQRGIHPPARRARNDTSCDVDCPERTGFVTLRRSAPRCRLRLGFLLRRLADGNLSGSRGFTSGVVPAICGRHENKGRCDGLDLGRTQGNVHVGSPSSVSQPADSGIWASIARTRAARRSYPWFT